MRFAGWLLVSLSMVCLGAAQETTYVAHYLADFPGPQVYKDPTSGTLVYVETDGRHVAAISGDGRLLWNRDPYKDGHLAFYRTKKPQIVFIGQPLKTQHPAGEEPDQFVAIGFNNSQFGVMRISNGDFHFLGQD